MFVKDHGGLSCPAPAENIMPYTARAAIPVCVSQDWYLKGFSLCTQTHNGVVIVPKISVHWPLSSLPTPNARHSNLTGMSLCNYRSSVDVAIWQFAALCLYVRVFKSIKPHQILTWLPLESLWLCYILFINNT